MPGEGEHKVMDMIRSFSEKVRQCILSVSTLVWLPIVFNVMSYSLLLHNVMTYTVIFKFYAM